MRPTYYVKHPDGTFSEADPQPSSMWENIVDFHEKFAIPQSVKPGQFNDEEMRDFRVKFLHEELREFEEGLAAGDVNEMADALVDLVVVAMGTAWILNFPWQELWDDVQRANMSKVRALSTSESKRGTTYDIVKPKNWQKPKTEEILNAYFSTVSSALTHKA
jgi:predicted HAD superfamily Cof-like phosphohydrolase